MVYRLADCSAQRIEHAGEHPQISKMQARILRGLVGDVTRLKDITETTDSFERGELFRTRTIDYKGDEVKTALPRHQTSTTQGDRFCKAN